MRKLLAKFLFATALSTTALACGHPHHQTFVKVEQVALGKVVVYRNGVAFYERRATVQGGKLTVSVPRERVDDFLKYLTVAHAKTQPPLPVSLPREHAEGRAFPEIQQVTAEHLRRVHLDQGRPLGGLVDDCVANILGQVRLLRQISSEFSSFASSPEPKPVPINLSGVVTEVGGPYRAGQRLAAGLR